jgi:hypothetical protein
VGDNQTFYYIPSLPHTYGVVPIGFGHYISYKPGDSYKTFLAGHFLSTNWTDPVNANMFSALSGACNWGATGSNAPAYVPRAFNQAGTAIGCSSHTGRTNENWANAIGVATSGMPYPNGPDAGLWVGPLFLIDHTGTTFNIRGRFPGFYAHQHTTVPQANYELTTGIVGLSGATLMAVYIGHNTSNGAGSTGMIHFDITGPWV